MAHPRVAPEIRDRVRDAFVGMADDAAAAALLARVSSPGFSAATEADYEAVRRVYRRAAR